MNGYFLIPANSKKSQLILGIFNTVDLIIFATGVGITLLLMLAIQAGDLGVMMLILSPAIIATFLVFPIPNYHNVLQLIKNIYSFFFVRQRKYIWRGWCYKYGNDDKQIK